MSAEMKPGDDVYYGVRVATIEKMDEKKAVIRWEADGGPMRMEVEVADLKPWGDQSPTQANPSQVGEASEQVQPEVPALPPAPPADDEEVAVEVEPSEDDTEPA